MKLVMPGDLFPTIIGQHWRDQITRSRTTPNKVSQQIKAEIDRRSKVMQKQKL